MSLSRQSQQLLRFSSRAPHLTLARPLATSRFRTFATSKDDFDRESLNPTSTENSKSGGDEAAAHESEAFDPKTTDPRTQHAKGGEREGGHSENPLDASPANPEVNQRVDLNRGGAESSPAQDSGSRKMSGGGSPKKGSGSKGDS